MTMIPSPEPQVTGPGTAKSVLSRLVYPAGPALAALCAVAAVTRSQALDIHALPGLSVGANALPSGVSADGSKVVGTSFLSSGDADRGFVWTLAGGSQAISGAPVSFATGISGDGSTAVGFAFDDNFNLFAYRYQNGTMQSLGSLDGTGFNAMANAVNFDGSVVTGQEPSAWRWTSAGGMKDLGTLNGVGYSLGLSISGSGAVIAGNSNSRAFRWTEADGMKALSSLPGSAFDAAYSVSADGLTIAGASNGQAVRWRNEEIQTLGGLAGLKYSSASSTSAGGHLIGGAAFQNQMEAFIWSSATGMLKLEDQLTAMGMDLTGWELEDVKGISADGSVLVGTGSFNGVLAGWVVTGYAAVPEPTAMASAAGLLGFGLMASWARARRQRQA